MKPWICMLLVMLLVPACAMGEIVGTARDGDFIHRYTAPNGQEIFYTSLEREALVKEEDVNFDGRLDLVIHTALGASNFFCEFFVYEDGQYVRAAHYGAEGGLCNYSLYPEAGLVMSNASNGYAGALFDNALFRWEGTDLRLLRWARSEEYQEYTWDESSSAHTTYRDRIEVVVTDHAADVYAPVKLYEAVFDLDATMERGWYEGIMEKMWQGLR